MAALALLYLTALFHVHVPVPIILWETHANPIHVFQVLVKAVAYALLYLIRLSRVLVHPAFTAILVNPIFVYLILARMVDYVHHFRIVRFLVHAFLVTMAAHAKPTCVSLVHAKMVARVHRFQTVHFRVLVQLTL